MSSRLVSRGNHPDDGANPSVVVVLRITVDHTGQTGVVVDLDESSSLDDAMWRPDESHHSAVANPEPALDRSLRHPHYADVELTETPVSRDRVHKRVGFGVGRLRRPALIAAAVAVALVAVVTVRSTVRPTLAAGATPTVAPPTAAVADRVMTPAAQTKWPLLDGENGHPTGAASPNPLSGITARTCRQLLVATALTVRADPATWILDVIDRGGRHGQTLDQVVHDRLVRTRTSLYRANHSDPEALYVLKVLDLLIADAADKPCSSTPCTARGIHPSSTRQEPGAAHAGWRWLCGP
jgi:hypothetical protein